MKSENEEVAEMMMTRSSVSSEAKRPRVLREVADLCLRRDWMKRYMRPVIEASEAVSVPRYTQRRWKGYQKDLSCWRSKDL